MKKNTMKKMLPALLAFCLILSACRGDKGTYNSNTNVNSIAESSQNETQPWENKKLTVVLAMDLFTSQDGTEKKEYKQIGDIQTITPSSYAQLIKDFEQETGVKISLLTGYRELKDISCDVVIYDSSHLGITNEQYDTNISYMNEEYCYDLTDFFEEDGLYDDDNYLTTVLKVGEIEGRQLVFPLSFNMSWLFTSEQSLERHSLSVSKDLTFDELVTEFEAAYRSAVGTMPLYQYGYHSISLSSLGFPRGIGSSPVHTFAEASGHMFSPDDEAFYGQMHELYTAFVESDLNTPLMMIRDSSNIEEIIDNSLVAGVNQFILTQQVGVFDEIVKDVGCFTSTDAQAVPIPFAAQAMFYESKYTELNENFICIAIPQKDQIDSYAAMATIYGVVPVDSKEPELGYQLLKYIVDHQNSPFCDLSVNINCVESVLSNLADISISVSNGSGNNQYTMRPISVETKEYLLDVINHIQYAYFLDPALENTVWEDMDRQLIGE